MADLKLKTVTRTQGNNQALKDGTVKPKTFEFDFEEVDPLIAAFRRMVRGNEFDICEMAITTYICAKAHGKPMTAIPVFLVRAFHHGAILVNTKAGIAARRTSKASGSASTAATRSPPACGRAASCRTSTASTSPRSPGCCRATSTSPSTSRPRTWCRSRRARRWTTCWPRASSSPRSASRSSHRTSSRSFPNALDAGLAALRTRGHYPINHTVVIKDELLAAHPGLAADVFNAFARVEAALSRAPQGRADREADRGRQGAPAGDGDHRRSVAVRHRANRKVLDELIGHAMTQGIITKPVSVDELFVPSTRGLVG